MKRRGFLALPGLALLARVASGIKRRIARRFVTVGKGGDHATLLAAWDEVAEAGGGEILLLSDDNSGSFIWGGNDT